MNNRRSSIPHSSFNDLSPQELEELIRQRRAGVASPLLPGKSPTGQAKTASPKPRRGWEKALLAIEILLIVALLLIFSVSARGWLALRQKLPVDGIILLTGPVLAASPVESIGPTPLPPIGLRQSQLSGQSASLRVEAQNLSPEVPAHLKKWLQPAQSIGPMTLPEPVAQPATRIIIPSINVDAPVGEGTDWEALKYQVGHHPGTANPGQRGNMVLAAHNDIYGEIFRYLPNVTIGESVTVYASEQRFHYRLTERRIIRPEQVEVMLPTTGPTVTLISCYPYLIDTYRIVLFGDLVE